MDGMYTCHRISVDLCCLTVYTKTMQVTQSIFPQRYQEVLGK